MAENNAEHPTEPSLESLERRKLELEIGKLSPSKTARFLSGLKGLTALIAVLGTLFVGFYTGLFDKARLALQAEKLALVEEKIERTRAAQDPKLKELDQEVAHKSRELETTSELADTLRGQLVEADLNNDTLLSRLQRTSSDYGKLLQDHNTLQQEHARVTRELSSTQRKLGYAERKRQELSSPLVTENRVFDLCLGDEGEQFECGNIEGKFFGKQPGRIALALRRPVGDGWIEKNVPKYAIVDWADFRVKYKIDREQWSELFAPRPDREPRRGDEQGLLARVQVTTSNGSVSDWSHIDRQTWRAIDNQFVSRSDGGQREEISRIQFQTEPVEVSLEDLLRPADKDKPQEPDAP